MPRHAAPKLEGMTVSQLVQLRDKIQTALSEKIQAEREELQRKISELSSFEGAAGIAAPSVSRAGRAARRAVGRPRGNGKTHSLKGRTVDPKYRDSANPTQTWAGRGLAPKWLTAYEQQGRKREEFLIGAAAGPRAKGRARK
jgi:DNA-binding protein H-NS